ncbi:hypothetical protein ACFQVA_11805 [Actinomadura keratinilytica]
MTSQPPLAKVEQAPEGPASPTPAEGQGSDGLQAGLKNRHLSMIAIGGVIGAASSSAPARASPPPDRPSSSRTPSSASWSSW